MIISTDAERAFDKIQHAFVIKSLRELERVGLEGTYLNILQTTYDSLTANIIVNGPRLESAPFFSYSTSVFPPFLPFSFLYEVTKSLASLVFIKTVLVEVIRCFATKLEVSPFFFKNKKVFWLFIFSLQFHFPMHSSYAWKCTNGFNSKGWKPNVSIV